jgi:hypothetical protein
MLTRFHKILIAALALQAALIVVVHTRGSDSAVVREQALLPGFDAAKVTRVQVYGPTGTGDGKPIDLVKRGADWVVASGFDYPADASKISDALSAVSKLAAAAPIATQAARHKQLHVADGDFERKLVITSGGKDLALFVGGAAGARRTAVRVGGSEDVYGVTGLGAATIGSEPRAWIDPSYVKVPSADIAKLTIVRDGKTIELARAPAPAADAKPGAGSAAGSGATIAGAPIALAAGETLDESAIERLLNTAGTIDATAPGDPKRDASKPVATITIERKPAAAPSAGAGSGSAGASAGSAAPASSPAPASPPAPAPPIVIDVVADGASYWVHDRSSPRAVLVDKARLDEVVGLERDKLVKKPAPPSAHGGAAAQLPEGIPPGALPPGFDPSAMMPPGAQ